MNPAAEIGAPTPIDQQRFASATEIETIAQLLRGSCATADVRATGLWYLFDAATELQGVCSFSDGARNAALARATAALLHQLVICAPNVPAGVPDKLVAAREMLQARAQPPPPLHPPAKRMRRARALYTCRIPSQAGIHSSPGPGSPNSPRSPAFARSASVHVETSSDGDASPPRGGLLPRGLLAEDSAPRAEKLADGAAEGAPPARGAEEQAIRRDARCAETCPF